MHNIMMSTNEAGYHGVHAFEDDEAGQAGDQQAIGDGREEEERTGQEPAVRMEQQVTSQTEQVSEGDESSTTNNLEADFSTSARQSPPSVTGNTGEETMDDHVKPSLGRRTPLLLVTV
jgi:hypothetical protein